MKKTIEWHEKCLTNMQDALAAEIAALKRHIARVRSRKNFVKMYAGQIEEAKRRKRTGFDRDKFMVTVERR